MKEISIENKEDLLQLLNNLQEDTIAKLDFEGEETDENNN